MNEQLVNLLGELSRLVNLPGEDLASLGLKAAGAICAVCVAAKLGWRVLRATWGVSWQAGAWTTRQGKKAIGWVFRPPVLSADCAQILSALDRALYALMPETDERESRYKRHWLTAGSLRARIDRETGALLTLQVSGYDVLGNLNAREQKLVRAKVQAVLERHLAELVEIARADVASTLASESGAIVNCLGSSAQPAIGL